ncbi:PIN domain-containing protein [Svornostia abyssi]|uniref:Ribonuclease VapC n=1 Tax=Svornostia abyssi TaxID=2898438 RepID=A0ABY5PBE3_9ACTN|nr:PIN domain-containing protein [Parviterribacteraceae bacterium J379]
MIAVDTNVLVYAHRADAPEHERAVSAVERLASDGAAWGLPWPVAHEFVKVMTGISWRPAPLDVTLRMLRRLLDAPGCVPMGEGADHVTRLETLAVAGRATGSLVYDARIAAICLDHGVTELWTADRDFGRFPQLRAVNPLVG